MKLFKHFITITKHRWIVRKICFKTNVKKAESKAETANNNPSFFLYNSIKILTNTTIKSVLPNFVI